MSDAAETERRRQVIAELDAEAIRKFIDLMENPPGCNRASAEVIERIVAAATAPEGTPLVRSWTKEELGLA